MEIRSYLFLGFALKDRLPTAPCEGLGQSGWTLGWDGCSINGGNKKTSLTLLAGGAFP